MPSTRLRWGRFIVYANDHPPPHVHVRLKDGSDYRIDLISSEFMDAEPPPGMRKKIMEAYRDNIERIRSEWERLHSSDDQRRAPADKQDRER